MERLGLELQHTHLSTISRRGSKPLSVTEGVHSVHPFAGDSGDTSVYSHILADRKSSAQPFTLQGPFRNCSPCSQPCFPSIASTVLCIPQVTPKCRTSPGTKSQVIDRYRYYHTTRTQRGRFRDSTVPTQSLLCSRNSSHARLCTAIRKAR